MSMIYDESYMAFDWFLVNHGLQIKIVILCNFLLHFDNHISFLMFISHWVIYETVKSGECFKKNINIKT